MNIVRHGHSNSLLVWDWPQSKFLRVEPAKISDDDFDLLVEFAGGIYQCVLEAVDSHNDDQIIRRECCKVDE